MAVALLDWQKVLLTAQALDASGAQVDFTAAPTWAVSDPALGSIETLPAGDERVPVGQYGAWLIAGAAGAGTVEASELAVAGDDSSAIMGSIDFTVTAQGTGLGTQINITAGTPQNKLAKGSRRR